MQLDVTNDASVESALGFIAEREGHLDVLVNNAGVSRRRDVTGPVASQVFDTNVIGVVRVTQAALPLLEQSESPVVVNVSSALGSFWAVTNPERRQFHFPSIVYGSSKAAVSMLTVQYAKTYPDDQVQRRRARLHRDRADAVQRRRAAGRDRGRGHRPHGHHRRDGPTGTFWEGEHQLGW